MKKKKPTSPTEAQLVKRRLRELELLTKSSHTLSSTLDLDELIGRVLKIVTDALAVENASILFPDQQNENMVFEMTRGKRRRSVAGLKIPIGVGVAGWVAKHHKPVVTNDLQSDQRYSRGLERELGLKTRSIMSIPLKRRGRLIGVIEAVNRKPDDPFTEGDLDVFLALGDHIAMAIDNAQLYQEAERRRLENSLLYEASIALGKSLSLEAGLEETLASLRKLVSFDAVAVFVIEARTQELVSQLQYGYRPGREDRIRLKLDEGIVGWSAQHKRGVIVPDTSQDDRYVNARRRTGSEMVTPMLSRGRVIGMFNLESNRKDAYTENDLRLLDSFAALAGVTIERARLYEEEHKKMEIEGELRVARTVQEFFTPARSRRYGPFTVTGRNYPSLELSGDYLDFFPLEEPYLAFAIADVAGKGVPASIIMAGFRATLHTAAPYYSSARDIAKVANQILLETVRPHDFVTALIGVLNYETGELSYANAGHEPPILMKPNGRSKLLEAGGTVLGVLEDYEMTEGQLLLNDELFFAYTDGAIDASNEKDEPFGRDRLVKLVRKNRHLTPAKICIEVRNHLRAFQKNAPQVDDLTFLVVKR